MAEGLEGLAVWQKAHELMLSIHQKVVPCLPREEKWNLADQLRRSSQSIGANIAMGYGRFYYQGSVRFCYNARGSLVETINHLIATRDLNYISSETYQQARNITDEVYRLIHGYIAYLKKSKQGVAEPGANLIVPESLVEYEIQLNDRPIDQSLVD